MDKRKNDNVNLEKVRIVFKGIGFVAIIGLIFLAFTFKTYNNVSYDFKVSIDEDQEDLPPLIQPATPPPPPPPPPPPAAPPEEPELEIVENDVEVEEEEFDDEDDEDKEIEESVEDDDEEEEEDDTPLTFVKDMPHYKECASGNNMERDRCTRMKIDKEIRKNFNYPDIARDMGLEGIVYVQFVVSKTGKVEKVSVIKGVHPHLDNAAIKAVQKLPALVPGKQLDKAVSLLYTVPVKIQLQ